MSGDSIALPLMNCLPGTVFPVLSNDPSYSPSFLYTRGAGFAQFKTSFGSNRTVYGRWKFELDIEETLPIMVFGDKPTANQRRKHIIAFASDFQTLTALIADIPSSTTTSQGKSLEDPIGQITATKSYKFDSEILSMVNFETPSSNEHRCAVLLKNGTLHTFQLSIVEDSSLTLLSLGDLRSNRLLKNDSSLNSKLHHLPLASKVLGYPLLTCISSECLSTTPSPTASSSPSPSLKASMRVSYIALDNQNTPSLLSAEVVQLPRSTSHVLSINSTSSDCANVTGEPNFFGIPPLPSNSPYAKGLVRGFDLSVTVSIDSLPHVLFYSYHPSGKLILVREFSSLLTPTRSSLPEETTKRPSKRGKKALPSPTDIPSSLPNTLFRLLSPTSFIECSYEKTQWLYCLREVFHGHAISEKRSLLRPQLNDVTDLEHLAIVCPEIREKKGEGESVASAHSLSRCQRALVVLSSSEVVSSTIVLRQLTLADSLALSSRFSPLLVTEKQPFSEALTRFSSSHLNKTQEKVLGLHNIPLTEYDALLHTLSEKTITLSTKQEKLLCELIQKSFLNDSLVLEGLAERRDSLPMSVKKALVTSPLLNAKDIARMVQESPKEMFLEIAKNGQVNRCVLIHELKEVLSVENAMMCLEMVTEWIESNTTMSEGHMKKTSPETPSALQSVELGILLFDAKFSQLVINSSSEYVSVLQRLKSAVQSALDDSSMAFNAMSAICSADVLLSGNKSQTSSFNLIEMQQLRIR